MSQQKLQQHLNETRTVLQSMESVQRYAQSEGKQSQLPSNINQTISGLREYINNAEANEQNTQFSQTAIEQASTQTRSAGGGSGSGSGPGSGSQR